MTDEELCDYVGIPRGHVIRMKFIAELTAEKRLTYERMRDVERSVESWLDGKGPKPRGVLIDLKRGR